MTVESLNRQRVLHLLETFGRGDIEGALACCTEDVDFLTHAPIDVLPHMGPRHGRDQLGEFWRTIWSRYSEVRHKAPQIVAEGDDLRNRLEANAARFRSAMTDAGFTLTGEGHPIIPVMLGDADLAGRFAVRLLAEGVYATAFSFPVVPNGTARIRTQMNADHTDADLDVAVAAFTKVGQELGVVS